MSEYTFTTQTQVRAAFWDSFPELSRKKIAYPINRKIYTCDTRCAFVDYVNSLQKTGAISYELAQRVTL